MRRDRHFVHVNKVARANQDRPDAPLAHIWCGKSLVETQLGNRFSVIGMMALLPRLMTLPRAVTGLRRSSKSARLLPSRLMAKPCVMSRRPVRAPGIAVALLTQTPRLCGSGERHGRREGRQASGAVNTPANTRISCRQTPDDRRAVVRRRCGGPPCPEPRPGDRADEGGGARKVATIEGITEYELDNGLRVLLFPDASAPRVTVNLTVLVGSRHEGYGETGMAHLLEHMVFKGTPHHPDVPKALRDHGANFNGTTWVDRTNYFETHARQPTRTSNSPSRSKPTAWSTASSSARTWPRK